MKFGKSLSNQIEETLPEWRDKFLCYKELKKRLKLLEPKAGKRPSKRHRHRVDSTSHMSQEEIDFIRSLEEELDKFNSFFVEQEEDYIIRLKELQDEVAKAKNFCEEMMKIRKEIVDFHGEMVLLENYSALNYTGLVKILKKYDKRTGALIRLPFIQRVLQQPFYTTDMLYKLIKGCETMLDHLFPTNHPSAVSADVVDRNDVCDPSTTTTCAATTTTSTNEEDAAVLTMPKELGEIEYMESLYMKSTISALRVLKEIRRGSSTVSAFSLPPLQVSSGVEEAWKKVPVLEQEAK